MAEDLHPETHGTLAPPLRGRSVDAVYDGSIVRPSVPLDLPPGTSVQVLLPEAAPVIGAASGGVDEPASGILSGITRSEWLLLLFGFAIYAVTRFYRLSDFPIYFFCDEAIQSNLAAALIANGMRDDAGNLFPPYFLNAEKWNLSLSVYLHAISVALFGVSVFVNRATSVVVSLLGVLAVTLTLRLAFQNRFWWLAPLVLAGLPTWFFHTRTAFETVMMASFYACFFCCYLLYRLYDSRWLYPALIFGAMTFYSYSNGQGIMLVSGLGLLFSDLRFHLRQSRSLLLGATGLLLVLLVPLLRFRALQPEAYAEQLRALDSYWFRTWPLNEKLARFAEHYVTGLSPVYWFVPNDLDLVRHRMAGIAHMPLLLLPFILIGLAVCFSQWRSSAHRAVLIAVLATPFSMALVGIAITRVLAMVVPATLLALIGLATFTTWVARWVAPRIVAGIATAGLTLFGAWLLQTALVDGPTWFEDYGLNGMQYGTVQLFADAIPAELARSPDVQLLVSPTWANNPNSFLDFFLTPAQAARVQLINIDAYTVSRRDLDPQRDLFIMPAYEYERAGASGKFVIEPPERVIDYPDGSPGFYIVRMRYVDNVAELFAADREARSQLVETTVQIAGQPVQVRHSLPDIGQIGDILDGDPFSLMRGFEANPLVIELDFDTPRVVNEIALTVGKMDFDLTLIATPIDGPAVVVQQQYRDLPPDPTVMVALPTAPQELAQLRLEILQVGAGEVAHVHVRELELR
jgi:4-amino-4-deoxy-L-arabinose transferase-like glycosyltransferase